MTSHTWTADHCVRLRRPSQVDAEELHRQYIDIFEIARVLKHGKPGMTNVIAWKDAINIVEKRKGEGHHLCAALLPPLQAFVGWSWSSSGVEQGFAAMRAALPPQALALQDARVEDVLTILGANLDPKAKALAISDAQKLWALHFGRMRASSTSVLKKVLKPKFKGPSEARWLRDRRAAVDMAAKEWIAGGGAKDLAAKLTRATNSSWSPQMQQEDDFQSRKRFARLLEVKGSVTEDREGGGRRVTKTQRVAWPSCCVWQTWVAL